MKKISFIVLIIFLFGSLFWMSCNKNNDSGFSVLQKNATQNLASASSTIPAIAGYFDIHDNITLLNTQVEYSVVFTNICNMSGFTNAIFINAEIVDDKPTDPRETANLILTGTYDDAGVSKSVKLGLELLKDGFNYAAIGAGAKWSCTGVNCAACDPIRSWGKVKGCQCLQIADDCSEVPASCTHSTSGGGNGGLGLGWATLIIGIFTAD